MPHSVSPENNQPPERSIAELLGESAGQFRRLRDQAVADQVRTSPEQRVSVVHAQPADGAVQAEQPMEKMVADWFSSRRGVKALGEPRGKEPGEDEAEEATLKYIISRAKDVGNLARTLGAQTLTARDTEVEEDLILMITVMNAESFARRLPKYPPEKLAIIVGDRSDIQELAVQAKVRVVIVTGTDTVDPGTVEEARRNGVSLLVSPHDTATTTMLCRAAVTVEHMVHEHFLSFREEESLKEIQPVAASSNFHAFPVVDAQNRMVGILAKSDFLKKVGRQLILVDHNELSQAVEGADQVEILEIIDHHRIQVTTHQPILFRNEPVGSTSTIVADCFFRNQVELPPPIAGLLLAGLVSDTLNLTSPTSTERDAQILRRLEEIADVKAGEFTEKLFASGSVLTSLPAAQALNLDCKEFQSDGRLFSVAQIEELGFDQFWRRKDELIAALENHRRQKEYFFSALLVTDVVRKTSLMLISGAAAFLKQIDYPSLEPGVYELASVVSRKKQLLPYLIHCLQSGGGRPTRDEPVTMV